LHQKVMEKNKNNEAFLRDLLRREETERAPAGFTEAVMGRVQAAETRHEGVLSTGTWIAILLGAAALVTTFIFIDMPFIDKLFSSSGIQRLSMNLFSNQFNTLFGSIFAFMKQNLIGFIIFLAFISLVIVERFISKKRSIPSLLII